MGAPVASGGKCYVFGIAVVDNPEHQAVLAPVTDRLRLEYVLQPLG